MDARSLPRSAGRRHHRLVACVIGVPFALAAAAVAADDPAAEVPPAPAFQPGEISIGEPIPLPFGGRSSPSDPPDTAASPTVAPADDPRAATPSNPASGAAVPGSGWLGLAVAESSVPGRWRVEEVTAGGPAARAGIAVGDELRAVNGVTLSSAADVSQTLTSIAAGQDVRVAVARADRVSDVMLRAEPRPAVRGDQATPSGVEFPANATARPSAPSASTPTSVRPPADEPAWQASQVPATAADAPRFGPAPARQDAAAAPGFMPHPEAAPAPLPAPATRGGGDVRTAGRTALGVRSVPVDPTTQARFNLAAPAGAYVVGVVQDLPAARAGVPPGSVIVALDDHPVRSPLELTDLVTRGPLDKPVTVQFVLPGGEAKRADVVLQALDAPLERALTGDAPRAGAPPELRPGPVPRQAERPVADEEPILVELRALRARLERLEQVLDPRSARGR